MPALKRGDVAVIEAMERKAALRAATGAACVLPSRERVRDLQRAMDAGADPDVLWAVIGRKEDA